MIPLEGRVVAGLDEFMLRLGHLKVLCGVVDDSGGTWSRVAREAGSLLTKPTTVREEQMDDVAHYLRMKRLCPVTIVGKPSADEAKEFRYPELAVVVDNGEERLTCGERSPVVWWQDLCLAESTVRSRVGAVTATRGKSGSKTGLSHICDWSMALDLVSSATQLTAEGRLLSRLSGRSKTGDWLKNPYLIAGDRIVFSQAILHADIDVFSRLAPRLAAHSGQIKKLDGTRAFTETIEEIGKEAEESRYLSHGQQFRIFQLLRDLENAVSRGGVRVGDLSSSSTAWHRTASRLESYVDLGLLEKGIRSDDEKYEYVYYVGEALKRCVETLQLASSAEEWIERYMGDCIFAQAREQDHIGTDELFGCLPRLMSALERPTAPVSIRALALGIVWLKSEDGVAVSLSSARQSIEHLARQQPEVARLSRGGAGERAEFISIELRKVGL